MNNEDGLSQNSVVSIAQDSTGYLWIATRSGLNRYNGKSFKYYNKQFDVYATLEGKVLGKVFIDRQDNLWIITTGGKLEKYKKGEDSFEAIRSIDSVSTIFQDDYSNLYFSDFRGDVYSIDYKSKDTTKVFSKSEGFIHHIISVNKDSLYFSSYDNVYSFNLKTHEYQPISNKNSKKNYALTKSPDGVVWLGTLGNGLYYKSPSDNNFLPASLINKKLPNDLYVLSLHVDKYNRLWVCTLRDGIFLLDLKQNTLEKLKFQEGNLYALSDNEILSLYEDENNVIWLGTNVSGLAYYDEYLSKFNVLTSNQTPNHIKLSAVSNIASNNKHNIFIGTPRGLTVFNTVTKDFKQINSENSKLYNNTISVLSYLGEKLYIGNGYHRGQKGGLSVLEENGTLFNIDLHYEDNQEVLFVGNVFKDSQESYWLGTDRGLMHWNRQNNVVESIKLGEKKALVASTKVVRNIVEDNNENLYVATRQNEIYKIKLNTKETSVVTDKIDNIKCIQFDNLNSSILWVGTNGNGLFAFNNETEEIINITMDWGLPDNVIYAVLPDQNNNLWLSTNRGIVRFKYRDVNDFEIETYGVNDGLQGLEFNTDSYCQDGNGNIYFGGLNGINWFNPENITKNPNIPNTIISNVCVLEKNIDFKSLNVFPYDSNSISFNFESLNFSKPGANHYKYRLVNHNDEWIESGNIATARYSNLPPNTYKFEVISSNYDGVWNDTPATYSFTILKPWYLSSLAKIVYGFLVFLSIYFIYRYLKWRWYMNMKLQLESQETARLKKLDEHKTKLYNNISHEFRTPLTLISGPVENQLNKPDLSEKDKNELDLIKRNSKRLLNLVNQLLDLSKLETGNLKLKVSKGNLGIILKQLASAFEFKAKEKNIDFIYNIGQIKNAWFDRDVIEKIVGNLLNNAVKYAPQHGFVKFEATVNQDYLTITVVNNGNNLKDDELPKLFQRYYQNNTHSEGVGIGLSLVKELTVLSHGNIIAHSINKEDIQFTVTLPIKQSYFNASEIIFVERDLEEIPFDESADIEAELLATNVSEKPVLLIVEDDKDIRNFVKGIFNDSYKILEAPDGDFGIQTALEQIPDIIVSDVMMPKIDGIELCNTLKENIKTSHIPIVLLTAKSGDHNEIVGLRTGAEAYMTKPFNSEKLKIRVDKLLNNRRKIQEYYSTNNALDFHNLQVNTSEKLFFERLEYAIKENILEQEFTSEKLASEMDMSRTQLHRKLKALLGLTTSEFIRNERLKIGVELLKKSDSTVSEIAYQIGFNTPSYFIKCFKDVYNCTPKEYLQSL